MGSVKGHSSAPYNTRPFSLLAGFKLAMIIILFYFYLYDYCCVCIMCEHMYISGGFRYVKAQVQ